MHRREELRAVDRAREQDRAQRAVDRRQLAERVEAGHAGHAEIEQEEVRPYRPHHTHRVFAALRFADDVESRAHVDAVDVLDDLRRDGEQLPQAGPEEALVVRQHHSNAPRRWSEGQ